MQTLKLPTALVTFANAMHHGDSVAEAAMTCVEYLDTLEGDLIENHSDYFLSALDSARFSNLLYLIDCARRMVLAPRRDWGERDFVAMAFEVASELEQFLEARNKPVFVQLAELDRVILTGLAVLQGRTDWECLERRLGPALGAVDRHRRAAARAHIPQQAAEALQYGFETVDCGVQELQAALDGAEDEQLRSALAYLKEGGELISVLVEWEIQCRLALSDHPLPVGGSELEELSEMAERRHPELARASSFFARKVLPELGRTWSAQRERVLMPVRVRDQAITRVDDALLAVEDALLESDPSRLGAACQELLDAFVHVRAHQMPVKSSLSNDFEVGLELLAMAWEGGMPDLVLREVAAKLASPGQPRAAKRGSVHLKDYFATRDRYFLADAAEQMLKALKELATPEWVLRGARCQCCDHSFQDNGAEFGCHHVGGSHSFLDLVA